MGVSLDYISTQPVSAEAHRRLLMLATEANAAYDWWCESIWIADAPDDTGCVFGSTKLFCMIDDEEADTYMASLDMSEIVRFLASTASELGVGWQLKIAGAAFGGVTAAGADAELQSNLSEFLDMFPGDFEQLRARSRADILAEWADR